MEKINCSATVSDTWSSHSCFNKATVCINGIYYCGIHNPINVKKREEKMSRRWQQEDDERNYKIYAVEYCKRKELSLKDLKEDSHLNGKESPDE